MTSNYFGNVRLATERTEVTEKSFVFLCVPCVLCGRKAMHRLRSRFHALVILSAILVLPALACSLAANAPSPEPPEAPTKFARAVILNMPPATPTATTEPSTPTPSPVATIRRALATSTAAAPATPTRTATVIATPASGGCPPIPLPTIKPSGLIKSVTIGTKNSGSALVIPTTVFQTTTTLHAIVALQNAPAKTRVKTAWYANDVGKAAPCNKLVDSAELGDLSGTLFVDFTLDPPHFVGTYRVEIYVNNNLDQVAPFIVK